MPVTIKDVARRVGRSVTTVSRALNDYDDVGQDTRQLIKKTAQEMGYVPSSFAQKLQKQQADTLGIILPITGSRLFDPFFSEFLAGIGHTVAAQNFDLLVSTRPHGEVELEGYHKKMRSRRVDGFIIVRTRCNDARIALLLEHNYPFAAFGRTEVADDFPLVDEDGQAGITMLVNHLVALGHVRFAFIGAPPELMFAHYRLKGFAETLETHNLPIDPALVVEGDLSQQSGREAALKLLDRPNPPTAIVACNDSMAIGAMSAAHQLGVVVGKDVAITGFDDTPWAAVTHPSLTTVHQPIYQIGQQVAEMLIKVIRGETLPEKQVILQPSLIVRQSSGGLNP